MHLVYKAYRLCIRKGGVAIASSSAWVGRAVHLAKCLVIRSDEEPLPVEEVPQFEDSPHNAEEFALRGGVVLLCSRESSAPISDRMKQFARFLLEKGTPDLVDTCDNVDDELPVVLWQGKCRCAQEGVANVFECGYGHVRRWWWIWWDLGPSQGVQGLRSFGKVLDETSIDVAHAQEVFQLGIYRWKLGMLQSINVLVIAHLQKNGGCRESEAERTTQRRNEVGLAVQQGTIKPLAEIFRQ